jgi:DNA topoisomerase VI subunit A
VDQAESDELITDLEVLTRMAREGLNIYPEERSAIFGNMTIAYTVPGYEGKRADLSANPDGVMIGPALTTAEFKDTDAEMVLAIEKGGLFTRFVEERVHKKYKAILINTAGQPPRSTRYLIRRLNQELGLPVGILCDADPWGAHIAMVIKSGSAGAAHLRELTTPAAVWLGVWASDIVKYKLPNDKLTEVDIKRLYELKADPRYTDKMWHEELDTFLKIKKKSEQEAFARYGLSYIVDKYLPEKLELMKHA